MKAYEIIKALEEGKKIRSLDGVDKGKEYSIEEIAGSDVLFYILAAPSSYEVLKEKKKIKLYRYTFKNCDHIHETNYTSLDFDHYLEKRGFYGSYVEPIKTKEKEIEIDDE